MTKVGKGCRNHTRCRRGTPVFGYFVIVANIQNTLRLKSLRRIFSTRCTLNRRKLRTRYRIEKQEIKRARERFYFIFIIVHFENVTRTSNNFVAR